MRRLFALLMVTGMGCWDFASLSGGFVPTTDGSEPDLTVCDKVPNALVEKCSDPNADENNNCIYGCNDPTCADNVTCLNGKGYRSYGSIAATAGACPGGTTGTAIFKDLQPQTTCTAECKPQSATPGCTSSIQVFADKANCDANTNGANTNLSTATACPAITAQNNSFFKLAALTPGACAPTAAKVALNAKWGTSSFLCEPSTVAFTTFTEMKKGGVACISFNGDVPTQCPQDFFPNPTVYYLGASGASDCNCTAALGANACSIGNNEVRLTDTNNACGTNNKTTTLAANTCVDAKDGGGAAYKATAVNFTATASCSASGTISGSFAPRSAVTVCCR